MVGLPRESKISRPIISAMLACILRGYDARCGCAVQQMLRKILSGIAGCRVARLSRAGFGVLAETIFKSPRSRDGFANTRDACATLATYALQKRFGLAISTEISTLWPDVGPRTNRFVVIADCCRRVDRW